MPNSIYNLSGRVENRGGKRKFVEREEPLYQPLKGDGATGIGEKGRLYFGAIRNPTKTRAFKPLSKKKQAPLDLNNLFKPSGVTSY